MTTSSASSLRCDDSNRIRRHAVDGATRRVIDGDGGDGGGDDDDDDDDGDDDDDDAVCDADARCVACGALGCSTTERSRRREDSLAHSRVRWRRRWRRVGRVRR